MEHKFSVFCIVLPSCFYRSCSFVSGSSLFSENLFRPCIYLKKKYLILLPLFCRLEETSGFNEAVYSALNAVKDGHSSLAEKSVNIAR